jgi:Protein of unknown function (DUF3634)
MPWPLFLLVIASALIVLYVAAERARTLAVCAIEGGKVRVVRGRLPAALLADIRDVVSRQRLPLGTIIVRKEDRRPTLRTRDIDDAIALQQLRNVVGRFPLAKFR